MAADSNPTSGRDFARNSAAHPAGNLAAIPVQGSATFAAPNPPAGPDLVAADAGVASRYFLAGAPLGKLAGRTVLLPFTTVAQLATWPERLLWGHARTEELCQWLDSRRMILGDDTVARVWARIMVAAERAGSVPPPNDAWIAAGCLSYGLPLATLHPRQYEYFALRYGLQLI
jgi:predicted nucleic acid-binding protein